MAKLHAKPLLPPHRFLPTPPLLFLAVVSQLSPPSSRPFPPSRVKGKALSLPLLPSDFPCLALPVALLAFCSLSPPTIPSPPRPPRHLPLPGAVSSPYPPSACRAHPLPSVAC